MKQGRRHLVKGTLNFMVFIIMLFQMMVLMVIEATREDWISEKRKRN